MRSCLDIPVKIFILPVETRHMHYRRVFCTLAKAYEKHPKTKSISERLAKISDKNISDLIIAEIQDKFNCNKHWYEGSIKQEDVLLSIYPEIALSMFKDDENVCPFAEDFVALSEESEFSSGLNEILNDIIENFDQPWNVWETRLINKRNDIELSCLGDFRILEWTRMVKEREIPFKNVSEHMDPKKEFLDPDILEINEACARDILSFKRRATKAFESVFLNGWGV